ncbi:MAG: sulfotransferase [Halioglobus sp.]
MNFIATKKTGHGADKPVSRLLRLAKNPKRLWPVLVRWYFLHVRSRAIRLFESENIDSAQSFAFFVGYPRSGHSLIGAILDAHPDCVCSHELNAIDYLRRGVSGRQVLSMVLARSEWFSKIDNIWTGYSYSIPGLSQGVYDKPVVLMDKMGGATTKLFRLNESLVVRVGSTLGKDVRALHVIRNPFDNISTRAMGGALNKNAVDTEQLQKSIDDHFDDIETNWKIIESDDLSVMTIRYERFLEDPVRELRRICGFLSLYPDSNYLKDSTAGVYESSSKSRSRVHWPRELRSQVELRSRKYEFLNGYTFD